MCHGGSAAHDRACLDAKSRGKSFANSMFVPSSLRLHVVCATHCGDGFQDGSLCEIPDPIQTLRRCLAHNIKTSLFVATYCVCLSTTHCVCLSTSDRVFTDCLRPWQVSCLRRIQWKRNTNDVSFTVQSLPTAPVPKMEPPPNKK
jgi:hypothetical protein